MRPYIYKTILTGVLAVAGAGTLMLLPTPGPPAATGQQPSVLTVELSEALGRAGAAERIPVLIEVPRVAAPDPMGIDRSLRAAEHAANLAGLYVSATEGLRRSVPSEVAIDLGSGDVIWVAGALTAQLTPDQVRSLEGQPGVRRLYYDGLVEVELAAPGAAPLLAWAPGFPLQDPAGGLPWGLVEIGAPELWAAGATGEGSVVASVDSGVDGSHPLLWRRWKGLETSSELAWFDPWGISAVPVDDEGLGGVGHGTIVMSTAVGSLEPGDTLITPFGTEIVQGELEVVTGVAPDAQWVAANAFEGFGGNSYTRLSVLLQSMQWVVDPDGDPFTVTDIPDVLNNSWGFRSDGCNGVFDRAIDALEFAGVPVVFSSGNRSTGLDTVAAPAQRADLLLNAFSVGAAELRDGELRVSANSLGGPSPCGPDAVKPEVVAPGEVPLVLDRGLNKAEVRGRSGTFTSWAAPHVSGSLAILRGLNPSASSNELKDALYSTAEDLPPSGPDNRSGAGFIDLPAAAERIGGLGGAQIAVSGWAWGARGVGLSVQLTNSGTMPFPGGTAVLLGSEGQSLSATVAAPDIAPRTRNEIVFSDLTSNSVAGERLRLRLQSGDAHLNIIFRLAAVSASSVVLDDGNVSMSIDGNGRLGGVAGTPGFSFLGGDWLSGGAFMLEARARVSDAAYVDVLQQPALKSDLVGSDTDWRSLSVEQESSGEASMSFADDRALYPLGADVAQAAQLVSIGDSAAFVLLTSVTVFQDGHRPLKGLLLDWDFGRDSATWDDGLGASVMTPADSNGPWMALTALPAPATHAAVPLGTPQGQFYEARSGVLAGLEGFTDSEKSRLMRLGGLPVSSGGVSDWAQLVTVGPVVSGEATTFLIAAGRTRQALRLAMDSARVVALLNPPEPPGSGVAVAAVGALQLQPAYPNPFDPYDVEAVRLPFLISRGNEPLPATLRVYTVSGILVHEERRQLSPDAPLQPFAWNGRLANGETAAAGVYGYVIRVGDERKWGKFLLLK